MKYKNDSGLPVEMQVLKAIKRARIAWDFSTLLRIKRGEVSKLIFENNAFRNQIYKKQAYSWTKNPINKPAMDKKYTLGSSCVSICISSGKRQ